MYVLCVGQKWVSAADFWTLPPGEIWWLIDAMMPKTGLQEGEAESLYAALMAAKEQEAA